MPGWIQLELLLSLETVAVEYFQPTTREKFGRQLFGKLSPAL